jgi:hypothetical protein
MPFSSTDSADSSLEYSAVKEKLYTNFFINILNVFRYLGSIA